MAENRKGTPHQAKHFQPEDHAHAAHQRDGARGHTQKPGPGGAADGNGPVRKTAHPAAQAPRGPRRGQ